MVLLTCEGKGLRTGVKLLRLVSGHLIILRSKKCEFCLQANTVILLLFSLCHLFSPSVSLQVIHLTSLLARERATHELLKIRLAFRFVWGFFPRENLTGHGFPKQAIPEGRRCPWSPSTLPLEQTRTALTFHFRGWGVGRASRSRSHQIIRYPR